MEHGNFNLEKDPDGSEEIVGEALKQSGIRDKVVLATKLRNQMDPEDENSSGLSRRHIIAEVEASLRRLQTDYIDLYQMHRPDRLVHCP